jgi:uncharacterized membrane protein YraQ (UPF0718 family)/copper chaperone CopZ
MILEYITSYFKVLIELTADMAPYLLLGFLFAGLLKVFLPQNMMSRYLGKSSFKSVANASLLGIPLPLCSCGVLPAGISLYKNGASKGSSVSFLISTPQTGVDSILVTWSMLGLPFALIRPVAALFTGIFGGVMTNKLEHEKKTPDEKHDEYEAIKQKPSLRAVLNYAFVEMMADIAKWLVIGLLIAALISVLIPDNFFQEFQISGILGMLIILVASIPLYICATSSVPIAAVLLMKGLSPGALLVFLMAGPATNAATMTVVGQNLGRKTLIIYLTALVVGSLVFGLFIDYFLPGNWFLPVLDMMDGHHHGLLPDWLNYGSAVVLTLMLINSFYLQYKEKMMMKKQKESQPVFTVDVPAMVIGVEGMTCEHCKAKVEHGLRSQENITNAVADTENNTVKLYGENIDPERTGQLVHELGYVFKGQITC